MTDSVRGCISKITKYGNFSYIIYKGKMGQKWPKMTIKWLKMVQLTPKLVILCIYDTFMNFQIFVKIALFLADFWPKNRVFFVFSGPKKKMQTLREKSISSFSFGQIGLKSFLKRNFT